MGVTTFGLYHLDFTFHNPHTGFNTTNRMYRVLGSPLRQYFQGVCGGIIGAISGSIFIDHDDYPPEESLVVTRGAFAGQRGWTGVYNTRTNGRDSMPGRVRIVFIDRATGFTYRWQRNIDYGSFYGSQMFLFDLASTSPIVSEFTIYEYIL